MKKIIEFIIILLLLNGCGVDRKTLVYYHSKNLLISRDKEYVIKQVIITIGFGDDTILNRKCNETICDKTFFLPSIDSLRKESKDSIFYVKVITSNLLKPNNTYRFHLKLDNSNYPDSVIIKSEYIM